MKSNHSFNFRSAGIDYASQNRNINHSNDNVNNTNNENNSLKNENSKTLNSYIQMNKNMKIKKSRYQKE